MRMVETKLHPCTQCGHPISPQAAACPSCGHPQVMEAKAKRGSNALPLLTICFIVGLIAVMGIIGSSNAPVKDSTTSPVRATAAAPEAKPEPTCRSDYHRCQDNNEVVDQHFDNDDLFIAVRCRIALENAVRYGKPDLPWMAFRTYSKGRSFIDTGHAVLFEQDAQVQNAFGAMMHVRARCDYDLKNNIASVSVEPR